MAKKYSLSVIVVNDREKRNEEFHVTDLSKRDVDDLGCYGLEQLARKKAEELGYEYVTFVI